MKQTPKVKLKYFIEDELSDKKLKDKDDWEMSYLPLKEGYRTREVVIRIIPKKITK